MKKQKKINYLFVVFLVLMTFSCNSESNEHKKDVRVIYLNGPSSVGKSVLVRALQKKLDEPYLHVGIDRVIAMMPENINHWWGEPAEEGFSWKEIRGPEGERMYELQKGPYAQRVIELNRQLVLTMLENGHNVIIDDISFGKEDVDKWRELLADYSVLYVGLHAPLEVIEQRERARGDRLPGSTRWQYYTVHVGNAYDLDIDTYHQTLEENVELILYRS